MTSTNLQPLDLGALKTITAARARQESARELLEALSSAGTLSGQEITELQAGWDCELDLDRQEYQELNGLTVTYDGGLKLEFGMCSCEISGLPDTEVGEELRAALEEEFGGMEVKSFTEELTVLGGHQEETFSLTGDELRALAEATQTEVYAAAP